MSLVLAAAIAVTGSVQFWDRACDARGVCALPSPLSDRIPVSGEVSEPAGPGQLGQLRVPLESGERVADFQVFWVAPPDGSTPYLVAQTRLKEGERLITECTQYASADTAAFFPVGMCSGFLPHDGGSRQVGVTFYKAAQ